MPPARRRAVGAADPSTGTAIHLREPVQQRRRGTPRRFLGFLRSALDPAPRSERGIVVLDRPSDLENRIGVRFKNPALLREALVHTSYLNENPGIDVGSNERLEFLGDAVLGLVVAQLLYQDHPEMDEGRLTELRAHLVRRDTLARAADRLGLGEHLQLGRGEEAAGGRKRPTNLARVFEAVVGAIYLDAGIEAASQFIFGALEAEIGSVRERRVPADPKSRLQEYAQSRWQATPVYRTVRIEGPDHARRFAVEVSVADDVLGSGEGRSKQLAEKAAAQNALDAIRRKELMAREQSG